MSIKRHSAEDPCPICGGHEKLPSGQGIRCYGFIADDGWAMCTREGEGSRAKYHSDASGWSHRIMGACPCGVVHMDDPEYLARNANTPGVGKVRPRSAERGGEVHSIGKAKRAELVETYDYVNLKGELLYQVCRMHPKSFRQRRKHPNGSGEWLWSMKADKAKGIPEQKTTLYQIPDLFAALDAGDTVYIVEGERDVKTLSEKDLVATCNTGGAGKWRPEMAKPFEKARGSIVVIADRDEPGARHARDIFDSIEPVVPEGISVSIVEAREGKDATDHFGAGLGVDDFVHLWPLSEALLATHPALFKRNVLKQALVMDDGALQRATSGEIAEDPPSFSSPLRGDNTIDRLQGVVTVAGAPSSGKSYFAIACGIDNAIREVNPWDVFYLNCEMGPDYVIDRSLRARASSDLTAYECQDQKHRDDSVAWAKNETIPANFVRVDVGIGVTMEEVIEFLADNVGDRPTLVIIDSISSFVDNMEEIDGDSFGMSNLRTVQKYACAVRRLTKGHVSWLILSELNKEGRAKGRSLDHRSDMAMSMTPDPDRGWIKNIKVTKSWFGPTGSLGEFVLWHDIARLSKVDPDV